MPNKEATMQKTVGFVGLGNMGKGMAANALKADFPLVVYDIAPKPVQELKAMGAEECASGAEVASRSSVLVLMTNSIEQTETAVLGPGGILEGLGADSILIVSATIGRHCATRLADRVTAKGAHMLDAPVCGGIGGAAAGTLTIMAGGPADVLERCRPLLEAMGEKIFHIGPHIGNGQLGKALNQLLVGIHLVAAAEVMVLGVKAGLSPRFLLDFLPETTGDSRMFRVKVPHMIDGKYQSGGVLSIHAKDLGIVLELGKEFSVPLIMSGTAHQMVQMAIAMGLDEKGDSAIVQVLEKVTGVSVVEPSE
jgi:3-hydroxyisobutyrate dehydrogenase-like beta-hydroxyacid dehydrogenase